MRGRGGGFNRFSLVLTILVAFIGINVTSKAFAAAGNITVHKGDMDNVPEQTLNVIKKLALQDAIITSDNGCFYTKETKQSADYINQDVYQIFAHHDINLGNLSLVWKNAAIDSNNKTCDVKLSFSNFNYPDGRPDEDSPIITAYTDKTIYFGPNPGTDSTKKYKYHSLTADAELSFTTSSGKAASGVYLFSFKDLDQVNKSLTNTVESVTLVDGYIGDAYIPTNSTLDISNNNKTYSGTESTDATDYTAGFVAPVQSLSHFHIESPGWAYMQLFDNFSKTLTLSVQGKGTVYDENGNKLLSHNTMKNSVTSEFILGWGTNKTLVFEPDTGYRRMLFKVDNSEALSDKDIPESYSFTNIREDHYVHIVFGYNYYTIHYNGNGETSGTMSDQFINYDQEKSLTANVFKKTGYKFTGWKRKDTGEAYSDQQKVLNLSSGLGDEIEMVAQWEPDPSALIPIQILIDGGPVTVESDSGLIINRTQSDYKDGEFIGSVQETIKTDYASANTTRTYKITAHDGFYISDIGWGRSEDSDHDSNIFLPTREAPVTYTYTTPQINLLQNQSYKYFLISTTPMAYYIQYNANGGTGNMNKTSINYEQSKALATNQFTYPNKKFVNWNTKPDGSGISYSDGQIVRNLITGNNNNRTYITLYAQWKSTVNTVTFIDGLTHKTITQQQVNHGESATPPAYPAHTGYTPTGWDKTASNITTDTTITVNYRPNMYTIRFDGNATGVAGSMSDMQMEYDKAKNLTSNAFSLAGHSWLKWNTAAAGNAKSYSNGQSVKNLTETDGGIVTLYAQWSTNAYTVTFVDGKTGRNISNVSVDYGGSVTPPAYPTHPGYTPTGWDKSTANVTQNMTVTVNYRQNRYKIHFDGNATGVTGSMVDMDIEYDKAKNLTTNAFALDGHSWLSWNTAANGSGKTYTNGQSVKNLTETDGGTVTLYAQWSTSSYTVTFVDGHDGKAIKQESVKYGGAATAPDAPKHEGYTSTHWDKQFDNVTSNITVTLEYIANEYTINFDGNGATSGNMQPLPMQYDKEKNLTANEFAREGYTWSGWNTKAGGSGTGYTDKQAVRNLTSENNGSVTLYAQWTPIAYRIQFDKNLTDATGETASMGMTFDVAKNLTSNGFTSPSSKFNCWNSKPDGSGQAYANGQSVKNLTKAPNDVVTLYAQWNTNSYTVTFVDGHDGKTISAPSVKYGGNATPPTKPSHEGYTATTWDGNYQNVTHDETVTLQYRPNAYKIAFKPNGGTGTMVDQQMEYDKAKALDRNAFTHTGYTFTGWKEQDADTRYADGETVKNLTSIDGGTIALLAQWEPNAYTIKYNANGGTGTMADQQMKYDTPAQLTANAYNKTGYTFTGWRRDDKATGTRYHNRETVTSLLSANGATATMYAQWKANEYTVTFIDGHNGKTIGTETVAYGSNATEPNKPVHEGYTATSWDKPLSNITGDTVITLSYRPNAYIIRFNKNAPDATGSTADKRMEYDKPGNLTRNGYSRTGYTWLGWSSSTDGNGTMYSDGQNVVNLTSEDGGTVMLYAVWKINRYTVTFIDGKTGDVIGRQEVDYGSDASFPSVPSHTGYIHGEWSGNGKNITSDTSITMSYIPISYTVAFNKNCDTASGKTPSQSMRYDQKDNLTANGFSRDGYTFSGWNAKQNASGQQYSDRQSVMNLTDKNGSTVTLYAQWVENGHVSILYKVETDDGAKGNENSVNNAMDDLNPVTGTAKGSTAEAGEAYDFVGWYDEEGKEISDSTKFIPDKPSDGEWKNASYTAKFSKKAFTVRFLGKDGNVIKEDSVKYGDDATAPEAPSIDGYEFSKWDKEFANVTTNLDVTAVYMELKKDDENASKGNANETEDSNGNVTSTTDNLIQTGIEVGVPAIGAISLAAIANAYRRKRRR